ncbi:hypothetical protein EVG20_g7038 [Dentipellis fragilis]|uniref:BTB domain-containing protein n=1 Tax=Dentipellis fragilis TaxID=205917 RepID=A0A4Y9YIF4_9AGAM|nr:hypothetical protein EVG20_g7038 [Dentipellis fragilis]
MGGAHPLRAGHGHRTKAGSPPPILHLPVVVWPQRHEICLVSLYSNESMRSYGFRKWFHLCNLRSPPSFRSVSESRTHINATFFLLSFARLLQAFWTISRRLDTWTQRTEQSAPDLDKATMDFGERLDRTAIIRSILSAYTFGTGLFKELLQNSDDAKATTQVLILDWRTHATEYLYNPVLADTQGPSLLAYNDAGFSEADWEGIRTIYQSSKLSDSSKIGKYGQGFRSCYHVTDTPQILSGNHLAIFDPQGKVHSSGGVRLEISEAAEKYADQLSGFDCLAPDAKDGQSFDGTIFRLPLRTKGSSIKDQPVDAGQVEELLHEFIRCQVSEVLLFLTHVSCIEIREIREDGIYRLLSRTTAKKVHSIPSSDKTGTVLEQHICTINVDTSIQHTAAGSRSWRVVHGSFPESEAVASLKQRCPSDDTRRILREQKLQAKAAIAFPLDQAARSITGSLFTYLPLPLQTGLPAHVHALFALTPDRQHLRNAEEIGLGQGFDRMSIAWNHFLFEKLIPAIWARALSIIVTDAKGDIFNAWPPQQRDHQTGDALYWKNLPRDVLREVMAHNLPVWPLIRTDVSMDPESRALTSVLVASKNVDQETLVSLAKAGVPITQPPDYLYSLLCEDSGGYTVLSPSLAAISLRENAKQLASLSDSGSDINRILVYLLSTQDLELVVGLPLFHTVANQYVALQKRRFLFNSTIYNLLSDDEMKALSINATCSEPSIALSHVPEAVRSLLLTQGPAQLTVSVLDGKAALRYLLDALTRRFAFKPNASPTDVTSPALLKWLVAFWDWLSSWKHRSELMPLLSSWYLLPTKGNVLRLATQVTFDSEDLGTNAVSALEAFGIVFIHPQMTHRAQQYLTVKSPRNHNDVIAHISITATQVSPTVSDALRGYLFTTLPLYSQRSKLTIGQRNKLKSLPIYPKLACPPLTSGRTIADRFISDLPPTGTLVSVTGMNLLPRIDGTTFLDGCQSVLEVFNGSGQVYRASDIVTLAINHFTSQSRGVQRAFLEYITRNHDSIPRGVLRELQDTEFVTVYGSRIARAPREVFNPRCEAASLFQHGNRLPSQVHDDEEAIVTCLQSLNLFRNVLDASLVQECISTICQLDASKGEDLARRLLKLLVSSRFDLRLVTIDHGLRWLPTEDGLRSCTECHHPDAHPLVLFDRVLCVLDLDHLPSSFKTAFAWDSDIPVSILKSQLISLAISRIPQAGRQLWPVIEEIGRRVHELHDQCLFELHASLSGHSWVPISHYQGTVASTEYAILCEAGSFSLPPNFFCVPQDLTAQPGVRKFLQRVGCRDRPSFSILIDELNKLSSLNNAILILRSIAELDVEDALRAQISIPDTNLALRASDAVYYNDVGHRAHLIDLPEDHYLAHDQIDRDLANRLQLKPLGLSGIPVPDDEDMGEDLTTRISGVLKQYSIGQTFGEFVSNAADAGASKFAVLVDNKEHVPSECASFLLPSEFQNGPSLVLYNDAEFQPKDWNGILRVGRGGKEESTNTIGQFGLGSLSSFHFTEVPMIVSGNRVLILDPSRSHLPEIGRASITMALSEVKRRYPDQLAVLDGLFGFDCQSDYYKGTIFRLALRQENQARDSKISRIAISQATLEILIKENLQIDATGMLLFTKLDAVEVYHRGRNGTILDWKVDRNIAVSKTAEGYNIKRLEILYHGVSDHVKEIWFTFTSSVRHSSLPEEFRALIDIYRLREPVITGLAITTSTHRSKHPSKFYSSVPLPLMASLPFHINGSFILASDRRNIRFDDNGLGNLESRYNLWLLQSRFPLVYAFALERLMPTSHDNDEPCHWAYLWPEHGRDSLSRAMLDAFYDSKFLSQLNRHICCSEAHVHQRPRDTFFVDVENNITKALRCLLPAELIIGEKPLSQSRSYKSIKTIDTNYVRDTIARKADVVIEEFQSGRLDARDLWRLIKFLLNDQQPSILDGLLLLPLADASLITFQQIGAADPNDDRMVYYWAGLRSDHYSRPSSHNVLPLNRLVHPKFPVVELQDKGFNVCKITPIYILKMLRQWLGEASFFRSPSSLDMQPRIAAFWTDWPGFEISGVSEAAISDFPLVPTTEPSFFISLSLCRSPAVIVLDTYTRTEDWLLEVLSHIGFIFVRRGCAGAALDVLLSATSEGSPGMTRVLEFLKSQPDKLRHIPELSGPLLPRFCSWARTNMPHNDSLLDIGRRLPIWQTLGNLTAYVPASNLRILPLAIADPGTILPFLHSPDTFIGYNVTLEHNLKLLPLTLQALHSSHLTIYPGQHLSGRQLQLYHRLLVILLNAPNNQTFTNVLVPNTAGTLVGANELYARSVSIFAAAFETRSESFVHHTYGGLERMLSVFGLHATLDFESFVICARAIDGDIDDPIHGITCMRRATQLFALYQSHALALEVGGNNSHWRRLDDLRFIPRNQTRCPSALLVLPDFDPAQYGLKHISDLVSPSQIVRPDLESVAWSQRGLFPAAPDQRLLLADLQLGVPSVSEVIDHLLVLSHIAQNHAGSARLLAEIRTTYDWLNKSIDHLELVQVFTTRAQDHLFLNIDRVQDLWTWRSVRELFFGIEDVPSKGLYGVREFLQPFSGLLCAIGVEDGSPLANLPRASISPAEERLVALRASFDMLRQRKRLTDVTLVSSESSGPEQLEGRWRAEAHRVVLAAASEHFDDMFCGAFREAKEITVDASPACLQCALDFIYTDTLSKPADTASETGLQAWYDVLTGLLSLSDFWQTQALCDAVQNELLDHVSITTYDALKQHAQSVRVVSAAALVAACQRYERDRASAIAKMSRA